MHLRNEFEGTDIQSQTQVSTDMLEGEINNASENDVKNFDLGQLKAYLERKKEEMQRFNVSIEKLIIFRRKHSPSGEQML